VQPSSHPSLARTVFTATLTVVAVVLGLLLLYMLRTPISWLVVATFVAVALSGPVAWLSRSRSSA
jgi:predicted PurR-regulated permease PerM